MLVRLDDKETRARLTAAEAKVAARKRERDAQPGTAGREDMRKAEDAVFAAERAVTNARFALDARIWPQTASRRAARRLYCRRASRWPSQGQAAPGARRLRFRPRQDQAPAPNRLEAGLIAARAELTTAEELLDKTRIRAPLTGSVLQMNAKSGELVAPSPELPLIVMGDLTVIRVRAEVDEPGRRQDQAGPEGLRAQQRLPRPRLRGQGDGARALAWASRAWARAAPAAPPTSRSWKS